MYLFISILKGFSCFHIQSECRVAIMNASAKGTLKSVKATNDEVLKQA
jgi:hypothetical protein